LFPQVNSNILFYRHADKPVRILKNADQLPNFLEAGLPGMVIIQNRYVAGLPPDVADELQMRQSVRERIQPWEPRSSNEKWTARL
jgi:hypothetical protein